MSIDSVKIYPHKLQNFNNGLKEAIIESRYTLEYGKRRKADGSYELIADMRSSMYPFSSVTDGLKVGISVYKVGSKPSATWEVILEDKDGTPKNKKLYLFLSPTTTYIHDEPKLPTIIEEAFDSDDIELSKTILKNKDNIYEVIQECGAFYSEKINYRQYAIVRSSISGELYQKTTETEIDPDDRKDPYEDKVNWKLMIKKDNEVNPKDFVTVDGMQDIPGIKKFTNKVYKNTAQSTVPETHELINKKEADELYHKIGAKADDSTKLNGLEPRDVSTTTGGPFIVQTNANGKIDDSFLPLNIVSNVEGKVLTVDVNKVDADNITTFQSIQAAYEAASKYIRLAPVVIEVKDGTYNMGGTGPVLNLNLIYDNSQISIIGNIDYPDKCVIQISSSQEGIFYCGKGLYINGFKITNIDTDKANTIGVNVDYGASIIFGPQMIIDNCKVGLYASNLSNVKADNMKVTNSDYAYIADASVISIDNATAENCIHGCVAENNATVYCKGSRFNKGIIDSGNTIGYISSYNSVIRAEDTSNGCNMDIKYKDVEESGKPNATGGVIAYS